MVGTFVTAVHEIRIELASKVALLRITAVLEVDLEKIIAKARKAAAKGKQ